MDTARREAEEMKKKEAERKAKKEAEKAKKAQTKASAPKKPPVFDNITEKYTYGHASNLEVTNASSDIITAQSNYVQAVMNVLSAQVALENLMGK